MKKIVLTIILTLLYSIGFSQIFKNPKNVFPYTPETSSLLKYQETPVSNYTGVPNISIPIYTAKSGSVEVPITLSYHAGGILVSEMASTVGLGWSISTIAPITRKINGLVDENGIMQPNDNIESFLNNNIDNQQNLLNQIRYPQSNQPLSDLMPDQFSLSVGDFSGSFLYNPKNKKMVTFPMSDLKIDYNKSGIQSKIIDTINVTATNGVKYTFGGEGTETFYNSAAHSSYFYGANAWKIKKIKGVDNNVIDFSYLSHIVIKSMLAPQARTIPYTLSITALGCSPSGSGSGINPVETDTQFVSTESLLEKIETADAVVSFIYSNRLDFKDLKKLDKIIVKNKSGVVISEKRFNYGYFETLAEPAGVSDATEDVTKRLKLLSYQECDRDGKCITTSFDYYEENKMTQRNSYSTDHWGYFNGKLYNSGYPNVPIKYYKSMGNSMATVEGFTKDIESSMIRIANKDVNPAYTQTFSLKSVTYPEGGKNEFIYEPNTASSLLYKPSDEHYFLKTKKVLEKGDFFVISGTVDGYNINYSQPPTTSSGSVTTFVREIDLSNYDRDLNLRITRASTFRASTFSNSLDSNYLYAQLSIYYFENGVKKYWINEVPLDNETVLEFHKFNSQNVPTQKVYAEIKHTYWGGLNPTGNISNYMYFYSQAGFSWEEADPNAVEAPIILGGGIRIKEIKRYDNGLYKYSTKYSYTKNGNAQLSSGILFDIPMYTKNNRVGRITSGSCYGPGGYVGVGKTVEDAIELSVNPVITGMRTQGKTIGYTNVEVTKTDAGNNIKGKEIFQYFVEPPLQTGDNFLATNESTSAKYEFMESRDWRNGELIKYTALNSANDTVKTVDRSFYTSGPPNAPADYFMQRNVKMILYNLISPVDYVPGAITIRDYGPPMSFATDLYVNGVFPSYIGMNTNLSPAPFPIFVKHSDAFLLKQEITTEYFNGGRKKAKKSEYFYDEPLYPTQLTSKKETFIGENVELNTSFKYAYNKGNQIMVNKNMLEIPLETETKKTANGTTKTLSKTETIYPVSLPTAQAGNLMLPVSVLSYDLQSNSASTELTYDKYDAKGNLLQYTTKDGLSTVVIWGYNQTQPIVKIEGAKLSDIQQSLIDTVVNASNTDAAAGNNNDETNLFTAFKNFTNNFPNYQVTTYSYDPLVGVRSITPPSGIRENYLYDSANRLEKIVDNNGKILKEMKYNYKN
ncbi:hypothetical protein F3J23_01075 [Chryseobacterium sp. Tr-659]|uniref:hypothetical protein n=1 Tax=Chryseobacterium sp. Tr-659 TaxID=2608340 RepID=UPI00141D99C0|nr:hypothetical protein [Chryseobacterium sp. Tr-659]NIF04018.1 hypothetical protein [Chryseobacterium sp. Tr-659]